MSENRAGLELAKWIAAAVAVLLGLYVGTYSFMVFRYGDLDGRVSAAYSLVDEHDLWGVPTEDSTIGRFFAPIHWLDRRIRPHVWEPAP